MEWIDKDLKLEDVVIVFDEDERQRRKWGNQQHDQHVWMTILMEEIGELAQAILRAEFDGRPHQDIKKEAIQVATLALKIAKMSVA